MPSRHNNGYNAIIRANYISKALSVPFIHPYDASGALSTFKHSGHASLNN